jgi:uncharacterized protein YndB with AHSA1/START domain
MAIQIRISAMVNAPIDRVWDSWTKPEHITKWNFADDSWHCPSASNDLKVGGKYIVRMEAKDGTLGFDFEATYDTIIDKQELTYTMPDGRKVTTIFVSDGNETSVTTTFDAESENPVELQKQGWQAILDNFKKYVQQAE